MPDIDLVRLDGRLRVDEAVVVNLYGGPGTGKSSTMAGVFSALKWKGLNCEQAPEFAKEKVWEGSTAILENQIYVFGKQLHTIYRVKDKVDVVITDSPLLLSLVYGKHLGQPFANLVFDTYSKFFNLNFFLRRKKKYNPSGRLQTAEKAKMIDEQIKEFLKSYGVRNYAVDAGPYAVDHIVSNIEQLLPVDRFEYK